MGCCATKPHDMGSRQTKLKHCQKVNTDTSVTEDVPSHQEDQQFHQYISKLRSAYNIQKYHSLWFNSNEQINLNSPYKLETDNYKIYCQITNINIEKSIKFALIVPITWQAVERSSSINNLIFVYCKQKREKKKADPVAIRIEKSHINKKDGIFEFSANLNAIVFMNLRLEVKSKNNY